MGSADASTDDQEADRLLKKTAVVIIHGMGEQRPMETLWGFVRAAWTTDPELVRKRAAQVYSKPDKITGNFELRRVTTRRPTGGGPRVDFFEFYWAHLMTGNRISSVVTWAVGLLIRRPSSVPAQLLPHWLIGLTLLVGSLFVAILAGLPGEIRPGWVPQAIWPWALIMGAAGGLISAFWLAPVAGDAARYLSPVPGNVAARQTIREAGIDLLTKLQSSGDYDRIIVVGHSLGTIIGYDVLSYAWGRIDKQAFWSTHRAEPRAMAALEELEHAAEALIAAPSEKVGQLRSAYRSAQRSYFEILATLRYENRPLWLVSDFITLGSPLSKAQVLLARNEGALEHKKQLRDLPCCPPWMEKHDPPRFSFYLRDPIRAPHHAAVFGPTVWTNIFFASALFAFGDVIAGPVAPLLGRGIRDVRLPIEAPVFRHLHYWARPTDEPTHYWIRALRRAINLRCHQEATLWGKETDKEFVSADRLPEHVIPQASSRQ